MKRKLLLMIPLFILGISCSLFGQEEINEAPQILTTDLTLKQVVQEDTMAVSFVILDDDLIVDIMINDEPVEFNVGNTVVIDRAFVFKPGKTIIKVTAMDEAGNSREKKYLVGYKLEDEDEFMAEDKDEKSKFFLNVSYGAAMETDSNPMSDPGLPGLSSATGNDPSAFTIPSGVVEDSEQADTKMSLNGTVILGYGNLVGFVGLSQSSYSKAANAYLGSLAIFLGAGYTINLSDSASLAINGLFLDVGLGGQDFSQNIGISPSMTFKSSDEEGSYTDKLVLDYTTINFADTALSTGSQLKLKWNYISLDPEKLDSYNRTYAFGTSSSGTADSQYMFLNLDYDWKNKWQSGLKFDIGFGFEFRSYSTATSLVPGVETRLDIPIRFSTGFGWQFKNNWVLGYNMNTKLTLSTNTIVTTRIVQGIKFSGSF